MKDLIISIILLATSQSIFAEKLTVYSCNRKLVSISPYSIDQSVEGDSDEVLLTVYLTDANLGVIDLKGQTLKPLHEIALKHDSSLEPFMGKGKVFLLKDSKDNFYAVFYEYNNKNVNNLSTRLGIGLLSKLPTSQGKYSLVGSYVDGTSFDKSLREALQKYVKIKKPTANP